LQPEQFIFTAENLVAIEQFVSYTKPHIVFNY